MKNEHIMRENSDGSIVAEIILVPICILRGHEIIFVGNCPHIDFFFYSGDGFTGA